MSPRLRYNIGTAYLATTVLAIVAASFLVDRWAATCGVVQLLAAGLVSTIVLAAASVWLVGRIRPDLIDAAFDPEPVDAEEAAIREVQSLIRAEHRRTLAEVTLDQITVAGRADFEHEFAEDLAWLDINARWRRRGWLRKLVRR